MQKQCFSVRSSGMRYLPFTFNRTMISPPDTSHRQRLPAPLRLLPSPLQQSSGQSNVGTRSRYSPLRPGWSSGVGALLGLCLWFYLGLGVYNMRRNDSRRSRVAAQGVGRISMGLSALRPTRLGRKGLHFAHLGRKYSQAELKIQCPPFNYVQS